MRLSRYLLNYEGEKFPIINFLIVFLEALCFLSHIFLNLESIQLHVKKYHWATNRVKKLIVAKCAKFIFWNFYCMICSTVPSNSCSYRLLKSATTTYKSKLWKYNCTLCNNKINSVLAATKYSKSATKTSE